MYIVCISSQPVLLTCIQLSSSPSSSLEIKVPSINTTPKSAEGQKNKKERKKRRKEGRKEDIKMSTPRIYLTRLTVEEHFDDFWEFWRDERGLVWSYVLFSSPLLSSLSCFLPYPVFFGVCLVVLSFYIRGR
jgi:hypothetical protein